MYKSLIKSFCDLFLAFAVLIIFFPILLLLSIALFFINKGNPFFLQLRPGKNRKPFRIVKFKTMSELYDDRGFPLPDETRITKIGSLLRRYSIDEIPQILNVIMREMSLIGPRPLLYEDINSYSEEQNKRHDVLPGITGLAQISGRETLSHEEKISLDLYYIQNLSFLLDLKIFFLTFFYVMDERLVKNLKTNNCNKNKINDHIN